jgi:hypothetical protein
MLAAQHNAIIELSAVPDKIQGAAAVERCAAISARAQTGRNNWPPSLIICLAPCCLVCFPERCGDHHTHRMSLIGRIIAACYRIRCAWKRRYNRTSWHLYCNRNTLSSRYGERFSPPLRSSLSFRACGVMAKTTIFVPPRVNADADADTVDTAMQDDNNGSTNKQT